MRAGPVGRLAPSLRAVAPRTYGCEDFVTETAYGGSWSVREPTRTQVVRDRRFTTTVALGEAIASTSGAEARTGRRGVPGGKVRATRRAAPRGGRGRPPPGRDGSETRENALERSLRPVTAWVPQSRPTEAPPRSCSRSIVAVAAARKGAPRSGSMWPSVHHSGSLVIPRTSRPISPNQRASWSCSKRE